MRPPALALALDRTITTHTTALLASARDGDASARDRLFRHVYDELRRLSGARLAAVGTATVSATGLVHEAYLKLVGSDGEYRDRAHFMGVAAQAMRHILVDRARARRALKRGGAEQPGTLDPGHVAAEDVSAERVLEVHDALDRLAARDADLAHVVELRFFGGLEVEEVAEALGISPRTAARRWAQAKAHLRSDLA